MIHEVMANCLGIVSLPAGAIVLTALLAACYTLYYRLARRYEPYNDLWTGRILLEFIFGLWGVRLVHLSPLELAFPALFCDIFPGYFHSHSFFVLILPFFLLQTVQILHLALLWGHNSVVAPSRITNWTGAGWMCRIYLTSALGVLAPLAAWFPFFLLAAGTKKTAPEKMIIQAYSDSQGFNDVKLIPSPKKRVGRAFFLAMLCVLPIALLQAAVAWVSYWVAYNGQSIEAQPRTLIGYFLAVFWVGSKQQCQSSATVPLSYSSSHVTHPPAPCTLCTYPAAAAIVHLLWTSVFLFALWGLYSRLVAAALNRVLKKRIRTTIVLLTIIAAIGCACIGCSVITGPFNWVNQGLFVGYVVTIAATVVLLSWKVVVLPIYTAHTATTTKVGNSILYYYILWL